MKAFLAVTKRFFAQIWSDAMLVMLLFVPILMGLAFRFGVPVLEGYLCARLGKGALLAPWYPLFDLFLSIMTPVMFTAAGAMVILDEADLGLTRAISVTPIGRQGYLASRIGVPALFATVYCLLATFLFRLSRISSLRLILLAVCSGTLSIMVALMISSLAKNKVEGLAFSKLSGLFVLGLPAALLIPAPYGYAFSLLPTFWMTKLAMGGTPWLALPALIAVALLSLCFICRFQKKVLA